MEAIYIANIPKLIKTNKSIIAIFFISRDDTTRTCDLIIPNDAF